MGSKEPYSFHWEDLRVEPIVITMPKIEASRYYPGQKWFPWFRLYGPEKVIMDKSW
ncbi:DUF1254 domain-containing protein [Marinobacter sp. BSs20148]|uniref:DUF1254 domain-containing protein n=1 Tax=Marinobacter sp. BSs20148 TaxID=490759 RepID=UPI00117D72CF